MGVESGRRSLRTEERPLNLTIGKALVIFKRAVWREWEEQTPIAEIKQGNGWRGQLRLVAEITHRECLGGERENWEGSEKRPAEEKQGRAPHSSLWPVWCRDLPFFCSSPCPSWAVSLMAATSTSQSCPRLPSAIPPPAPRQTPASRLCGPRYSGNTTRPQGQS